jgi:hypothetical protein
MCKDIPEQNNPSVRIFQHTILSQWGYSRTKYSVSKESPVPACAYVCVCVHIIQMCVARVPYMCMNVTDVYDEMHACVCVRVGACYEMI